MEPISDEQILTNLLSHLRDRARLFAHILEVNPHSNPDIRNLQQGEIDDTLRDARALHRFMIAHGVRGLGPVDY